MWRDLSEEVLHMIVGRFYQRKVRADLLVAEWQAEQLRTGAPTAADIPMSPSVRARLGTHPPRSLSLAGHVVDQFVERFQPLAMAERHLTAFCRRVNRSSQHSPRVALFASILGLGVDESYFADSSEALVSLLAALSVDKRCKAKLSDAVADAFIPVSVAIRYVSSNEWT